MVDDSPLNSTETGEDKKSLWILLAVLFGAFAFYQWYFSISQQVSRNIKRLSHPQATVSGEAWTELQHLFYYEWDAFEAILDNLDNRDPITFLIVAKESEQEEATSDTLVFEAMRKPLFFKSDTVYCRTVREALFAIIHNDDKTQVAFSGNWESWWKANRDYFRRR